MKLNVNLIMKMSFYYLKSMESKLTLNYKLHNKQAINPGTNCFISYLCAAVLWYSKESRSDK